ncbi:MAG: hypothetical protein CO141_04005 [Candidatus Moranbacteria bacterium CG_4_9_14_3_um_filter_42_9]|nr:MAG: hypothetical protein CO141_04005 [Candidatus Moranbacteria bacterium CG_4_9_14_3_um_filter_42_9]
MFEKPPKEDGKDSNVTDLSEWRDKKAKGETGKKPKKMGRPKSRKVALNPTPDNQEKIIPDKAKVAADFIERFEEKFISSLGNQIQELRKNLYEEKEYIFWINATNLSQEIEHWERELENIQIELEKNNEVELLKTVKIYIKNFAFFRFSEAIIRTEANQDAWFILKKFEELARKFEK